MWCLHVLFWSSYVYRSSICTYMYAICVKYGMHSYKFPGAVFHNNFSPVLVHTWSQGQATSKYSIQTWSGAFISEIWIHYYIHVHTSTYMYSHTHTHTRTCTTSQLSYMLYRSASLRTFIHLRQLDRHHHDFVTRRHQMREDERKRERGGGERASVYPSATWPYFHKWVARAAVFKPTPHYH